MYRYQVRGWSLTIPGRLIRMTVIAANADDARKVAAIRNPDFGRTKQTPRRLGRFVDEQADGLTASKAREFVEWRGTEVEVVD